MTPADRVRVVDRYVETGDKPAAIAAALGLDPREVAAELAPAATSVTPAPAPRPKRARKASAKAPAPANTGTAAAEAGDVADPGRTLRGRDSVTSQRNYGFGYAAVVTGRRPI